MSAATDLEAGRAPIPRVGLDCFREAIRHGGDDALLVAIRAPTGAHCSDVMRLEWARRRLLALVDQIEREDNEQ